MPFIVLIKNYFVFVFGCYFIAIHKAKKVLFFSNSSEKMQFPGIKAKLFCRKIAIVFSYIFISFCKNFISMCAFHRFFCAFNRFY